MTSTGDGVGPNALDAAVLRISDERGTPVGAGFLVTSDLAFTCAHVVAAALGRPGRDMPPTGARVRVDLPLAGTGAAPIGASVEHWSGDRDIAVLRLDSPPPGARPLRLVQAHDVWDHPMRSFGFPAGRESGVWHSGRLLDRQGDGWIQAELASPGGYRVTGGFSGGPVWDEKLVGVVGMVVVAEAANPPASYLIPTDGLLAPWPELAAVALPESPFRSLSAFGESDAKVFFGRATESAQVAEEVRATSLVCLVGPSGCGKSSLAMAGVVPRLRREGFEAAVLRPASADSPLLALAAALLPLFEPGLTGLRQLEEVPALAAVLAEQGLRPVVDRILQNTGGRRLLVIIDQCEELLVAPPDDIAALARLLLADGALPESVRVLITLRADFLEPALADPSLGPAVSRRIHALRPMPRQQLHEVVTAPLAAIPSVRYESGLVDRILDDAGEAPGVLPLLGLTLDLLWREQTGGRLTHEAYDRLGQVAGALGRHADAVWRESVPEGAERAARRLFTRLIRVPAGSGAITRRLAARAELDAAEWDIAQRLAATRLLVTGSSAEGGETLELAHEALITDWPKLATWVAEDHGFLAWHETVRLDMERWRAAGEPVQLLPTTVALTAAQSWLSERAADIGAPERDFLDRGRHHHQASARRRRGLFSGISLVVVLALILGSLYVYQRQVSQERQAEANSRALASLSADEKTQDPAKAIMLALAAYRTSPTEEAKNTLLRYYAEYGIGSRLLSGTLGAVAGMQTSRDGNVVLARSVGGRVTLFVHAVRGRVRSQVLEAPVSAVSPMVSGDGRRVGFIGTDGSVVWYDVHPDAPSLVGPAHQLPEKDTDAAGGLYSDTKAAMSADGRLVVSAGETKVVWWDLEKGTVGGRIAPPVEVGDVWFGPDEDTILGRGLIRPDRPDFRLVAMNRRTLTTRTLADRFSKVAVSADGRYAAICDDTKDVLYNAVYTSLRISDGVKLGRYTAKDDTCGPLAIDTAGRHLVYEDLRTAALVDLRQGKRLSTVEQPEGASEYARIVTSGSKLLLIRRNDSGIFGTQLPKQSPISVSRSEFTADGTAIISVVQGGALMEVWPVKGTRRIAQAQRAEPRWDGGTSDHIALNEDGTLLADREGDNKVVLREVPSLRLVSAITTATPPKQYDTSLLSYFFSQSGQLVTVSGKEIQLWDSETGRLMDSYDARGLPGADGEDIDIAVSGHPAPGHVAIVVEDDPYVHIVDLRDGRQTDRLKVGEGARAVQFDPSGRYFALLRSGRNIELWRRDPLRKELGPLSSIADVVPRFVARFLDDTGRYLLANNNKVQIYQIGQRAYQESFDLGPYGTDSASGLPQYYFVDVSRDGRTVLYTQNYATSEGNRGGVLFLQPDTWADGLCQVIGGREFTPDERRSSPVQIPPGPVCPG